VIARAVIARVLLLGAAAVVACTQFRRGRPAPQAHRVLVTQFRFSPGILTLMTGDRVTWINQDRFVHTVFFEAGRWASGDLQFGQSFTFDVSEAGTYQYYCSAHPSMRGTLVVTARP